MRLEPIYTVTFTTPEAWSVEVAGDAGIEGRSFLLAEGRSTGRLSARFRAANFPRKRADGALVPEFRGVLETDDGGAILFEWQGLAVRSDSGTRRLLGSLVHIDRPPALPLAERPRLCGRGRGPPAYRRIRIRGGV